MMEPAFAKGEVTMIESSNGWLAAGSLAIAIIAVSIGIYNHFARLRACIVFSVLKRTGTFFLSIKNSGPGTATVTSLRRKNFDGSLVKFKYAGDRKVFPFDLGSGASYELTLDPKEAACTNVEVEWRDFKHRGPCGIPVSQFVQFF